MNKLINRYWATLITFFFNPFSQQDFSEEEVADASFSFSASTIEQMLLEPARQVAQLDDTSPGVAVNMWFQNRYTLPGDIVDYSRLLYMKGKGHFQRDKNHYYVSHSKVIIYSH